jgi:hypothetical protein
MSNIIDMSKFGQLPATMRALLAANPDLVGNELSAGVMSSMAVMSYRGKVWRVKYRKQEVNIVDGNGDPRPSIEVVIVKAAGHLSKIYYPKGYNPDANEPPVCWSTNALTPDASVPPEQRQSATCAACPHNVFGSKITENGKQAKACTDSKRLAVVPLDDIDNEVFGGPMLLRIPAASLGDLVAYDNTLRQIGFPYMAVGTRLRFDPNAEFPKLTFSAIRPLNEVEAAKVVALMQSPTVARIINEAVEIETPEAEAPTPQSVFEQPPEPAPKPAPKVEAKPAPKPAPKAELKPVPKPEPVKKPLEQMSITEQIRADAEAEGVTIQLDAEEAIDETDESAPSELDDIIEGLLRT